MIPEHDSEMWNDFGAAFVGGHQSYWLASTQRTDYGPGDTTVDVAIIGGGIAGLTTALLLKEEGEARPSAVVEADRIVVGDHSGLYHGKDHGPAQLDIRLPVTQL